MAFVNGSLSINGIQYDVASGTINIGPFSIPFSAVSKSVSVPAAATNQAVSVPDGCNGVAIIPNATANMTVEFGWASGQVEYISPVNPTVISFDETNPNMPANLYFTVSNNGGELVQVVFW